MNKFLKRIISIFIIGVMIFSSSPISSFNFNVNAAEIINPITATEYIECNLNYNEGISLFSRGVYSGCYGNQLNTISKEMYDNFVKYYINKRNYGSNSQKLVNAYTFNTTHTNGNINENAEYTATIQTMICDFDAAISAFLYDYPEVFWFRGMSLKYSIEGLEVTGNKVKCGISNITFIPKEIVPGYSSNMTRFDNAVENIYLELKSQFTNDTPLKTKLKIIHDYICQKSYYSYSGVMVDLRVHSPAPFFIGDGGIVCEGYAKVFKILCDKFGIPCACISGYAYDQNGSGEAHMWNYVKMDDGKWYLVDLTWDDQESKIYYTYFIACSNTIGFYDNCIEDERIAYTDFSGSGYSNFIYPILSSTEYQPCNHIWQTEYTTDKKATCTSNGIKSLHCTLCEATKDEITILATGHKYSSWKTQSKSTCSVKGEKYRTCSNCNKKETIAIDKLSHSYDSGKVTKAATCKTTGIKTYTCTVCKAKKTSTIAKVSHSYTTKYKKATTSNNGLSYKECSKCKATKDKTTIYKIKSVKLSTTAYTYNGKVKKPTVTVKDSNNKTISSSYYTVTYPSGRKNVGKYTVTVTFKGKYSGTKKLNFTIIPAKTTVSKVTTGKKSLTVSVTKKSTQVTGYQIQYSTSKKFTSPKTKTITSYKTTKTKISGLTAKKTYYVRVRTYKTVGGKKYYSTWSTAKSQKTK